MLKRKESNKILLLYLLSIMDGCKNKETRLQCMVFQIQKAIREKGSTQTFNYHFIRWHLGAYSQELHEDITFLLEKGFIEKEGFKVSKKISDFLDNQVSFLEKFFYLGEDFFLSKVQELKEVDIQTLLARAYMEHELKTQKMGKVIQHVLYDTDYYERKRLNTW